MPTAVNLDGAIVPPAEARVSIFDRGFLQGDSVYEVLRTYGGRPFEPARHLARLARSADRAGLPLPWDAARARLEIERTLEAARGADAPDPDAAPWNAGERSVRLVVTRGGGEAWPSVAPAWLVIAEPLHAPPLAAYRDGVRLELVEVDRSGVDASAKTGARLSHVLALRAARAAGAHEALFADAHGQVTEGTSSNLFLVRDGRLVTPPLAAGILEGVTRGLVLALARQEGVPAAEAPVAEAELGAADEIFITSTAREILPATRLGELHVGDGRPGPVTRRLHAAFRRLADAAARG
ncbi:MAG TPA: aminotransferase class IV [Anaeromyxobacteraceae bacterium]|nr:aminotransferase class IV [Anaeromyxobacteraceae bacterium]